MIETGASENASDTITFSHSFRMKTTEAKHMMPRQFATVYKTSLINWHIQISESGGGGLPAIFRNIVDPQSRDTVHQITLHPAGQRENHPPVLSVEFRIRVIDLSGKDIITPIRFVHPPGFPARSVFTAGYCTPEHGPVKDWLGTVIGHKHFENHFFEIHTFVNFDVNVFLNMKYLNRSFGKPMPLDLNFRYNLLTNQNSHDFHLTTSTHLSFPCNKEALFVASPYFRKQLTDDMISFPLAVEFLESIEVVITWLLTETYHPPFEMTPELAREIVTLAEMILPRGPTQRQLFGSIERHCFEELIKHHEDMMYVKHMMLVAHNHKLGSLLEACHATIITYHLADFYRDMQQNPSLAFTQQLGLNRASALGRLYENYTRSLYVKCYTIKTPTTQTSQSL
ncbi:unnamed protein product [Caenorhabditis nigoni]